MKFWENGFFENQNAEQSRKWISDERWQELLDGQSSGYEIFTNENREPDLRTHVATEEELQERRIYEIQSELNSLNQDIVQDAAGEVVPEIEKRKQRFRTLHNELREMFNKNKRDVKKIEQD